MVTGCGVSSATGTAANSARTLERCGPMAASTTSSSATVSQNTASTQGKIGAELVHQQAPGSEILVVTNKGTTPLTVDGWPTLSFLNAANGSLAVPVQKVSQPGAATKTTIQPGQSAFAGVKLVLGDKGDSTTSVATTTNLTIPGAPTTVVSLIGDDGHAAAYPELDLKSVQVGTFQPSMQGVSPDGW